MSQGDLEPDYIAANQHFWYGHRKLRKRSELELCWKVAKAVAAGDGVLSDEERIALVGKMTATAVPEAVIEAVMRWDPHTESPHDLFAQLKVSPEARIELGHWMVYEGLSIGFADGALGLGEIDSVRALAEEMGVPASTVDALIALCREEAVMRLRRIKTLQGKIAIAAPKAEVAADYELVPVTVRGAPLAGGR